MNHILSDLKGISIQAGVKAGFSSSLYAPSGADDDDDAALVACIIVLLFCLAFVGFLIYLCCTGKFSQFINGFKRSGPRSATVRYSSLTGDNDWLEDDDDDIGGDVSGAAPVVVVQDTEANNAPAASTSNSNSSAPVATATKDSASGAAGSWEIKWDEDLDDDGGISAWGTLPVNKPSSSGSSAPSQKPVGTNPFEDDDNI